MSIKPAMGWLALLLFTTTAQAEGSRELLKGAPKMSSKAPVTAAVTPKTKAVPVVAKTPSGTAQTLAILESTSKPRSDYQAEVYAGTALDSPTAKARGLDKGLVSMVFERQQRPAFRVARDRIKRVVRLAPVDDASASALVRTSATASPRDGEPSIAAGQAARTAPGGLVRGAPRGSIDVLDTEGGVILVDTTVHGAGLFVTSDVYTFAKNATLDQRIAALESVPSPARARLREALVAAEWAPLR